MGEGGVDLEHDDEELQEVDVHLHRFLTDELLPAMVNQIRNAAGPTYSWLNSDKLLSLKWFFNVNYMRITQYKQDMTTVSLR